MNAKTWLMQKLGPTKSGLIFYLVLLLTYSTVRYEYFYIQAGRIAYRPLWHFYGRVADLQRVAFQKSLGVLCSVARRP